MSYMKHIEVCNQYDLSRYVVFKTTSGEHIGWIKNENIKILEKYHDIFEFSDDQILLKPDDVSERTAVMERVSRDLVAIGHLKNWRDEPYKVAPTFFVDPLFIIDRSAISFFGIKAYGVHMNGYVKTQTGLKMWIARRASDRYVAPNKLDNMVAGGQPADLGLKENLIKECQEEAGLPQHLAKQAKSVGFIGYAMESDQGLKPDVMYVYDLELPIDFTPENTDGEVAGFELLDIDEVARIVKDTMDFKFNCNLVIIDFLIRHGVIDPDTSADYEALVRGLRPQNLL